MQFHNESDMNPQPGSSRQDKAQGWTRRKVSEEFGASDYIVRQAKKLVKEHGLLALLNPRITPFPEEKVDLVTDYYKMRKQAESCQVKWISFWWSKTKRRNMLKSTRLSATERSLPEVQRNPSRHKDWIFYVCCSETKRMCSCCRKWNSLAGLDERYLSNL